MDWKPGNRVKVLPTHYGSGLQKRLGTVVRVVIGRLDTPMVEVEMDSHYLAGTGTVVFKPEDLTATTR